MAKPISNARACKSENKIFWDLHTVLQQSATQSICLQSYTVEVKPPCNFILLNPANTLAGTSLVPVQQELVLAAVTVLLGF